VEEINDAKTHDPIDRAYAFLHGNGWYEERQGCCLPPHARLCPHNLARLQHPTARALSLS
jgi:hypothetical protein